MLPGPNGAISCPIRICLFPIPVALLHVVQGAVGRLGSHLAGLIAASDSSNSSGVALSDCEFGGAIHLPHAARYYRAAPLLKGRGELSWPEHEILTSEFWRKFLPQLWVLLPFP